MTVCACGRITNGSRPLCDLCSALVLLGLKHGAAETEIKDAYRVLAKVWHPDRFQGDEHLRRKAEEKLKEINSAYQLLTTTAREGTYSESARPAAQQDASARRPSRQEPKGTAEPGSWRQASSSSPDEKGRKETAATGRRATAAASGKRLAKKTQLAIMVALLVAGGVWIGWRYGYPAMSQFTTVVFTDTSVTHQTKTSAADGSPEPNSLARPTEPAGVVTRTKPEASPRASLLVYPPEDPQVPYFTVGSTRNDVIRAQGTPTRNTNTLLGYGLSEVYFKDGRVQSWRIDPTSPLKARLLPASQVDSQGYFTVGSSKDEVFDVQGTPSQFTDDVFVYGHSKVYFKEDRVQSWHIDSSSPLKVRMPQQ